MIRYKIKKGDGGGGEEEIQIQIINTCINHGPSKNLTGIRGGRLVKHSLA